MPETYARVSRTTPLVALGPRVFRKEMLRIGEWRHPDAPDGKLRVTKEMFAKIISNFQAGLRDNVPVPLGHDLDAIENSGHVVGLEASEDRLYGLIEVKDDEIAEGIEKGLLTGGSALINLNYVDSESGKEHGETLIHWAITNAPYIKGLAPYEAVALGEDAKGATIIALSDNGGKEGSVDPIKEALEALKEASDEDIRKALAEIRPDVLKAEGDETTDLEEVKAEARKEGQAAIVAALSEKGIEVKLEESDEDDKEPKIDVTKAPEFVALSEKIIEMETKAARKEAEDFIDEAIDQGKVLPTQKEPLVEIALSEGGMEKVKKLIPEKAVVDLKEHGVDTSQPTVTLSEEDADTEADRLVGAYSSTAKKKED